MKLIPLQLVVLLRLLSSSVVVVVFGEQAERRQQQAETAIHVRYGYFAESRPTHTACGRGWFDLSLGGVKYEVSCHPQT